jgi:putative DNA primase/helicase
MSRVPFHSRSRPSTRDASSRISAADIARALGGTRSGRGYMARCPAHDDRSPSLSLADSADGADSRVLVRCHAGCSQDAVITALKARGLWPTAAGWSRNQSPSRQASRSTDGEDEGRREYALALWANACPVEGSVAEEYLRHRGITTALPIALRFHPHLKHVPSGTSWPAMIGLMTNAGSGEPMGVHRTYLSACGTKKAPVEPTKMMLGTAMGSVVQLAEASDAVMIGEGIETCLSVQQVSGAPTWAALSAGGLKALNLPPGIRTVTLLADGDPAGEAAVVGAARRLRSSGRIVRIVRAPSGTDFNDVLNSNSHQGDQS